MNIKLWVLTFIGLILTLEVSADTNKDLLAQLNSGNHLALMRHELAPGTGDPASFKVKDCTTQRNLDDQGRSQSIATGNYLRSQGVEFEFIYSSQWCRCLETARLLNHGHVQELPMLNSFFQSMELADSRTNQLREWLTSKTFSAPTLLVTHQVNISALTGEFARSGEIIIVAITEDGEVQVKGKLLPR